MNRSQVLMHQGTVCRHCGCLIYEVLPEMTHHTVKGRTFTAPLRRKWWHNATAEEVSTASKERGVPYIHVAEP